MKEKSRFQKKDVIIILSLVIFAALSFILIYLVLPKTGDKVVITVNGEEYGTYPLSVDKEIEIKQKDKTNIIVIENGEVYMKEADCPDKLCIKMGKKSKGGQSIICLPNKISAEVITGEDKYDSIAQ